MLHQERSKYCKLQSRRLWTSARLLLHTTEPQYVVDMPAHPSDWISRHPVKLSLFHQAGGSCAVLSEEAHIFIAQNIGAGAHLRAVRRRRGVESHPAVVTSVNLLPTRVVSRSAGKQAPAGSAVGHVTSGPANGLRAYAAP